MKGTATERFWAKVEKTDNCWNWTGGMSHGYGRFSDEQKNSVPAHRFSYLATYGDIEEGKIVDHICRNRGCVRPDHLRAVTHAENSQHQDGHSDSRSGYRGVSWHAPTRQWRAVAQKGGRKYSGGYFSTAEKAAEAARQLRNELMTHNNLDRSAA